MVSQISLTQNQFALIDDSDFEWINQWKWYAHKQSTKHKVIFYAERFVNKKNIQMHRIILNPKKSEIIDHINGNGLDNRRSNLRIVSKRQNSQNRFTKKTSKYPGVDFVKQTSKWRARTSVNGKTLNLGYFDSENKAFEAYKKVVYDLTGEKVIG